METSLHLQGHSFFAVAVFSLLAAAGLLLYVWRIRGTVGRRDRIVLVGLRLLAVLGLVAAFFQVGVRREDVVRRRSAVFVLVDESASMGALGAEGMSRAEHVSRFFREHAEWFNTLEENHDVAYFAFATRPRQVSRSDLEMPLASNGGTTDVSGSIRSVLSGASPHEVGGVLVFSDGLANVAAAGDEERPSGFPAAVYGFLPPLPESVRNVSISRVDGLTYLLQRELAEVRVEVRTVGVPAGTLRVALSEAGEVLDTADLATGDADAVSVATLHFLPRNPGRTVIDVNVSSVSDEVSDEDNAWPVLVDVVRDRLRVLHVAGHPSWDERFLREYLRRRPDVQLVSFHTLRSPDVLLSSTDDDTTLIPFPAEDLFVREIEGFDLIVLQDFDLPDIDRDRFAQGLTGYVRKGGALLLVGGSFSLGTRGLWPAYLDPVLPVVAPRISGHPMIEGRFVVEATPQGERHPVLSSPRLREMLERALPLRAVTPTGGVDAGATVLLQSAAEHGVPGSGKPLVVVQPVGAGRVAVVLTDTLWRWSFDPDLDELYRRFLDSLAAWLSRDPSSASLGVAVQARSVLPGESVDADVTFSTDVRDVQALLRRRSPSGRFEDAGPAGHLEASDLGRASLRLMPPAPGSYRLLVSGEEGEARLEASDAFVVGPSREEILGALDSEKDLSSLATLTGGRVAPLAEPALEDVRLKPEVVARLGVGAPDPLWNHPIAFVILLIVLALEWFIERKTGYT